MTDLVVVHQDAAALVSQQLQETIEDAKSFLEDARAKSTLRAYTTNWRQFVDWCQPMGLSPLPAAPETLALYLTECARSHTISTLQRRMAAIAWQHQEQRFESPTKSALVQNLMKGIRRKKGVAQVGKIPAVTETIQKMVNTLPETPTGIRDRAVLLVGFAGAFRRSELVALTMADVDFTTDGLVVQVRRSKTDQEGAGFSKGIPYGSHPHTCPVRALRAWLAAAGITAGPLFRKIDQWGHLGTNALSDASVALIIKKAAKAAGLNASDFAGHSLRAGLVTAAAARGVNERDIMKQTGHRSTQTLRKYIRDGSLFRDNPAASVGL